MAFAHASGTATSFANWFSIFETWIESTIGWTVVSGTGTEDLVLSSDGEYGDYAGYTGPIYVRIYSSTIYIYGQAYLDASGTKATPVSTGIRFTLNASGDSFDYWMTADKEAMVLYAKNLTSGNYNRIYVGTLIPYAKTLSGPEYMMIAHGLSTTSYVLQDYDGAWAAIQLTYHQDSALITDLNQLDNSVTLFALHVGTTDQRMGQFRHISARTYINELSTFDRIKTGPSGSETEWIMLPSDNGTTILSALRTGGVVSSGEDSEANFQITSGWATSQSDFFVRLQAFMVGTLGWTVESGSGTEDIVFSSIGESGTDTIIVHFDSVTDSIISYQAQDDLVPTHETSIAYMRNLGPTDSPKYYYFVGDKDCICIVTRDKDNTWPMMWAGALVPFSRNLPNTNYKSFVYGTHNSETQKLLLKQQTAASWNYATTREYAAGWDAPNPLDPLAYFVIPGYIYQAAAPKIAVGRMKYIYRSTEAITLSVGDTIQSGNRIFMHLRHTIAGWYALRIQ